MAGGAPFTRHAGKTCSLGRLGSVRKEARCDTKPCWCATAGAADNADANGFQTSLKDVKIERAE